MHLGHIGTARLERLSPDCVGRPDPGAREAANDPCVAPTAVWPAAEP